MPLPAAWWRWQYDRESRAWDRRSREPIVTSVREDVVALLLGATAAKGPMPGLIHRFSEADVRALFSGLETVELRLVGATHVALLRNPEAL